MDKKETIRILSGAFNCEADLQIYGLTDEDYRILEKDLSLMRPEDVLKYLPRVLINILEVSADDYNTRERLLDLLIRLDVCISEKEYPSHDVYIEKVLKEEHFALLTNSHASAISEWLDYIDDHFFKHDVTDNYYRILQNVKLYWRNRCQSK
jgi:hypothetical protein